MRQGGRAGRNDQAQRFDVLRAGSRLRQDGDFVDARLRKGADLKIDKSLNGARRDRRESPVRNLLENLQVRSDGKIGPRRLVINGDVGQPVAVKVAEDGLLRRLAKVRDRLGVRRRSVLRGVGDGNLRRADQERFGFAVAVDVADVNGMIIRRRRNDRRLLKFQAVRRRRFALENNVRIAVRDEEFRRRGQTAHIADGADRGRVQRQAVAKRRFRSELRFAVGERKGVQRYDRRRAVDRAPEDQDAVFFDDPFDNGRTDRTQVGDVFLRRRPGNIGQDKGIRRQRRRTVDRNDALTPAERRDVG